MDNNNALVEDYVNAHKKEQAIGFWLTLGLGPIGLFYSSWPIALVLILLLYSLGPVVGFLWGVFVIWPSSILLSWVVIAFYNRKVRFKAELLARDS